MASAADVPAMAIRRDTPWSLAVAAAVMVVFLLGASLWVVDGGPGPRGLFHVGAIDIASIAVMGVALMTAGRVLQPIGPNPGTRAAR